MKMLITVGIVNGVMIQLMTYLILKKNQILTLPLDQVLGQDHDPFGLNRSKSSSRSSSWSTIMIEESPVNSKPSTPTDKSYPVILSPRDTNDLDDSDILYSYSVILSPRDTGDLDNSD